jgi:hypothetical protein
MRPLKSLDALYNFITTVVLCAPDKFPVRDYLADDEQMNLDRAFNQLRLAIDMAYPPPDHVAKRVKLASLLDASLAGYREGDKTTGAALLEDFRDNIFARKS